MTSTLTGRTVLITGAARGIGAQLARVCAARGARVALVGLEPLRLRALAAELDAVWHEADVTDQRGLDEAAERVVATTGGIDAVVTNAGIANLGTVAVCDPDAMARTIDVNLTGTVRTVAATLPAVAERRGYYLLVSSAAAFTALPGLAAYCAAKAGVEQFGTALRQETAHLGVGVGTAHPSWVDTDLVRDAMADLTTLRATIARLPGPLGRTVSVQSCAEALVRGLERRSRRVYVPRSVGLVQAARTVVQSPLVEAVLRRRAAGLVPELEADVRRLGRFFGRHSLGVTGHLDHHAEPDRQAGGGQQPGRERTR